MLGAHSVACDVCSLSSTSEYNFLLRCHICTRAFHHRCCQPPIPDEVLTSLIKATSKKKPGKGILFWKCYECREGKTPATLPRQATSSTGSVTVTPQKRKQAEVIVISDDDGEPGREEAGSPRPSTQKRDVADKTQPLSPASAPNKVGTAEGFSSIKIVRQPHFPTPRQVNEDVVSTRRTTPHEIPSTSTTQSTRFGLLSPPTSVGGSTIRFPSSTPFFPDDSDDTAGPSSTRPETEISIQPPAFTHTILPTPPISARNTSPSPNAQMPPPAPPAPRTWKTDGIKQDLKLLSQQFQDTYHTSFAVSRPTSGRARKPRKPTVTTKINRTSEKHFCYHFGTPE